LVACLRIFMLFLNNYMNTLKVEARITGDAT